MLILPLTTPILKDGDDLAALLAAHEKFLEGDIIVISSKAIATVQGARIDLQKIQPSPEAQEWARRSGRSPTFRQAVLDETKRLKGRVVGGSELAMLTEVSPEGLKGTLLVPNAGLDQSNVPDGFAIGWPLDPIASATLLRTRLQESTGKRLAVIVSDSCCRPRRWGVTAFALVACGLQPLTSQIGRKDLFGRPLTMTVEAVADQLATAANAVMGNADQSIPAAIIREYGVALNDFCDWVPGIEPEDDLFKGAF
ncbi:coenzyme F420-0:L-glutamate ligase [Candidatus Peribacteria bacterium RIFOXYC1_FULL_58_8]|nr:MAG: coenzyme F420-0:L-glutamate ligase [Candidatus Peribacteria bacterium RIFOXYB1_FULL_57_12]OGJ83069.1 MAG: coenzyme F420-0:L-glutamate ligase [Candidatus Peribacteria bacterium RIFOXYC1_FULL_58_8]